MDGLNPIAPTGATGGVAAIAGYQVQTLAQQNAAALAASQTTVDVSPLGKFLSAVSLFQKRLLEQQASGSTATSDPTGAFAALESSTVALAEAANQLQASGIGGTGVASDAPDNQLLATLFKQQFAAQAAGGEESESSGLTDLAAIGLNFTSPTTVDDEGNPILAASGNLTVDLPALQAAFENDPAAAAALLGRTAATFGSLAGIDPNAEADELDFLALTPAPADPLALDLTQPQVPAPAGSTNAAAPGQPTQDGAFLQRLLAETSSQAAALASPPAANELPVQTDLLTPRPLEAEPAPQAPTPAANAALEGERAPATLNATPPQAAPDPAANDNPADSAGTIQARAEIDNASSPAPTPDPDPLASEAQAAARELADEVLAARNALRNENEQRVQADIDEDAAAGARPDLVPRSVDAQAAARSLSEQVLEARNAIRTENDQLDQAKLAERAALALASENARIAANDDARAAERVRQERLLAGETADPAAAETVRSALRPVPVDQAAPLNDDGVLVPAPLPAPVPVNAALPSARDPAVAAAIAAYSLNSGLFSVLNGRPELAAPKIKTVAAVETVRAVDPIDTSTEPHDGSRPFR